MILVDANLLLYAYDSLSAKHQEARLWMEEAFSGIEPVRLSWPVILAFLRISTNTRLRSAPFTLEEAAAIVDEWFMRPNVDLLEPGERHWQILRHLLPESQARGPLVSDAHIAALAIEHGAVLYTTDRDFSRFERLQWHNPLEPKRQ